VQRPLLYSILGRFGLGMAGGVGAGYLAFRAAVFDPVQAPFQCVTLGALTAGVLALVRASRPLHALVLAAGFALLRLGLAGSAGWGVASTGPILAGGILLIALIYDLLRQNGMVFGKFLIVGPLLGGVFLVAAPLSEFETLTQFNAMRTLLRHGFIGMVIGEGVSFGVEIVDLAALAAGRVSAAGASDAAGGDEAGHA
jgi:hypothetical protein